ncbi:type IV secretory system conjugative DNA transfer family protein [Sinomonas gamaensis]|uniref:type IV secretory system conjugative DNA transfer family protein n=1 Tax=Sinomonas gamaensis TaxID=2565624 RepID=UPI001108AC2A|nr:type IV secretory system conjugative DNA transfer family protein [Sinomonas gamaensis]
MIRLTRAGNLETNPQQFGQRTAAFASAVARGQAATLLTRRDASGMHGAVLLDEKAYAANAALPLAQAVGAHAERAELPDDLADAAVVGRLVHRNSVVLRETQAGIDPGELPRLLANAMPEGSWVAVTMRAPSNRERKRHVPWLAHRLGTAVPTHHSLSGNAMVVSVMAGGPSEDEVASILAQLAAAMPGFDLDTEVVFPRTRSRLRFGAPIAALLALAAIIGVPMVPDTMWAYAPSAHGLAQPALFAAAVVAGLLGAAAASGRIPSEDTRLRRALAAAAFPPPASRRTAPAPPRKESTLKKVDSHGNPYEKRIAASDGDYPLAQDTFLMAPNAFAAIVSPHAGAISGAASTAARSAPPAVRAPIGPVLGPTEDGDVHLSAAALLFGTAIVGQPGSGKSLLVRSLFGWHCLERVKPSGKPGHPGAANALVAFESKGDGTRKYLRWAHALSDRLLIVDAGDPSTPGIDLFAVPGDNTAKAEFFVNAMRYAFGEDSVGWRSMQTLIPVFTAALSVDDELLSEAEQLDLRLIEPGRSPVFYANVLLAQLGDAAGVSLANAIHQRAVKLRERGTPDLQLEKAWNGLLPMYDSNITPAARRGLFDAPSSKVKTLLDLDEWWTPTRRKVSWAEVLEGHRSVVINTGSSETGRILEEATNQMISSMLMYGLRHAILRTCSGWLEQGRSVTVFADELSLLAGTSPEIIAWIRDQGRSYGVRAVFATQRPEQLGSYLRNNFLTYGTLISFAQTDPTTAREIAENAGSDWSAADVQHLEPYHVLVRTGVDQRRQPAFTVHLPEWESDIEAYAAAQGYAEKPAAVAAKPWLEVEA